MRIEMSFKSLALTFDPPGSAFQVLDYSCVPPCLLSRGPRHRYTTKRSLLVPKKGGNESFNLMTFATGPLPAGGPSLRLWSRTHWPSLTLAVLRQRPELDTVFILGTRGGIGPMVQGCSLPTPPPAAILVPCDGWRPCFCPVKDE